MTDTPSDAAKRKACELANAQEPEIGLVWTPEDINCSTIRALALHLDEVDRAAREIEACTNDALLLECARSLMLPDPPDPDEELAREIAAELNGAYIHFDVCFAAIKRLREQGRLTDAK